MPVKRLLEELQRATAELAAAATPPEVAAVVFRALLGLGAKDGGIFLLGPDDQVELVFDHDADPETRALLQRFEVESLQPVADAVRQGSPLWLEGEEAIRGSYPALEEQRRRRGDGVWAVLPLASHGRAYGALAFTFAAGKPSPVEARSFSLALANLAAQALDRARLFEDQKRLAERLSQVHSAAAALSGAATPGEVAEIAFGALAAAGASSAEVWALDLSDRIARVAVRGAAAAGEAALRLESPHPAADVVRSGRALWLESADEVAARYPAFAAGRAAAGERSWAAVPLLAEGKPLGALVAGFARARLDPGDRTFVRMLALPCAFALERARSHEREAAHRAEALRSAAVLEALCCAAPVGVALMDREMRLVRVNEQLARITGLPADAHLGRTPGELVPGVAGEALTRTFREVVETGATLLGVERSGETAAEPGVTRRWTEDWYPVRVAGEIVGVGVLVREIGDAPGDAGTLRPASAPT
jgi:GAF domain-containing protein